MLFALFSFCTGEVRANGVETVQEKGELVVALHKEDWPPFFCANKDGELWGLDIDMARNIASNLGVRIRFTRDAKTFDEIVEEVESGRADIAVSYLSDTLERGKHVRFTQPYLSLYQAMLVNRLEKVRARRGINIDDVINYEGVRIGVLSGSAAVSYAHDYYPKAEVVRYDSNDALIRDARKGQIFAVMSDEVDIRNMLGVYPDAAIDIEVVVLRNRPDTLAIAVSMDNPDLQCWLDLYLRKIRQNGFLDHLIHLYIETNICRTDSNR